MGFNSGFKGLKIQPPITSAAIKVILESVSFEGRSEIMTLVITTGVK